MPKPPFASHEVKAVFDGYPRLIRSRLLALRQLILQTAAETAGLDELQETLKWGEPSFVTRPKLGSTIRIDWKPAKPEQYAIYFNCKTRLVETFKELYGDKLKYEGNRAIVFAIDEDIPSREIKHCISLSLTYHKRKHLPLLGA